MKTVARYAYLPLLVAMVDGGAIVLCSRRVSELALPLLIVVAVCASFAAERLIPYEPRWNTPLDDASRDVAHGLVNESLIATSVAIIPVLAVVHIGGSLWPSALPFFVQVLIAVTVADLGVTLVHAASHHVDFMWRFHAVHHSVRRLYGFNGLMKHPVHQAMEMAGGVLPLLLLGIPQAVAAALAVCVALQLLLQHSNVDYRVGPLRGWLSLNEGHRFHHLRWAGEGDVNFGLFTLVWDRALGTYSFDRGRTFATGDLGIDAKPDYPIGYRSQLAYPFRRAGGCEFGNNVAEPEQAAVIERVSP